LEKKREKIHFVILIGNFLKRHLKRNRSIFFNKSCF